MQITFSGTRGRCKNPRAKLLARKLIQAPIASVAVRSKELILFLFIYGLLLFPLFCGLLFFVLFFCLFVFCFFFCMVHVLVSFLAMQSS